MNVTAHRKTPEPKTARRSSYPDMDYFLHLFSTEVTTLRFHGDDPLPFSVCPRCKKSLDREFQKYCDNCGQKLSWNRFKSGCLIEEHILGPGQIEYRRIVLLQARTTSRGGDDGSAERG